MKKLIFVILLFVFGQSYATNYHIATTGNDANTGTSLAQAWKTWEHLNGRLQAGDTCFIHGGTYNSSHNGATSVQCGWSNFTGNSGNGIVITNYQNEIVIFDLWSIGVPTTCYLYGIYIQNCSYLTVNGIIIRNMRQVASGCGISRGMSLNTSNHCTISRVEIYNMGGTAFIFEDATDNLVVNCDFHHNGDPLSVQNPGDPPGTDAWDNSDGWSATSNGTLPPNTSTRNTVRTCRTWLNSDDGDDLFGTNGEMHYEGNWSFWNGYKPWGPDSTQVSPSTMTVGNPAIFRHNVAYEGSSGEGFKMGPARVAEPTTLRHFVQNCLSVENRGTGYASNSDASLTTQMQFWNNVAYSNDNDGFSFGAGWSVGVAQIFKNNWAFNNNQAISGGNMAYDGLATNLSNNCWMPPNYQNAYGNLYPTVQVSAADFLSVSSLGLDGARNSDGSLPYLNFLRLAPTSDLIDKGINVGLPYCGTSPDVNWVEYCATLVATCGSNQTITLPVTTATITGTGTGGQTPYVYTWRQLTGTATTIVNTSAQTTSVQFTIAGTYTYEFKITDNLGATALDTITVTVNAAAATAPTCNSGTTPVTITLPTNSIALNGTGASTAGNTVSYLWTPSPSATITNNISAVTTATGLTAQTYNFTLKVTDNVNSLFCTSVKVVTVNSAPNVPPTVFAGLDQTLVLPTDSTTLTGTAIAVSGTIVSYSWIQISGTACTIVSPSSANTKITGLGSGVFLFKFTATDSNALSASDTVQVKVLTVLPLNGIRWLNASLNSGRVKLSWQSLTANVNYFAVNRNNDSVAKVVSVPLISKYNYTDSFPKYGSNFYTVKGVDLDNNSFYSSTISVVNQPPFKVNSASISQSRLLLDITSQKDQVASLSLYDVLGRTLLISNVVLVAGSNIISKTVKAIKQLYYLKISVPNYTETLKLF